ncbi:MAG: bifunctional glutamate N-acetyltransferase/amino-acid acetyltransferase ArgJ [Firmicutes bacterium]|nr:bifunctional glutamate N-acetyltransferase/amino-acid acetyltransferase ArgJ [Bacillota bacterium]
MMPAPLQIPRGFRFAAAACGLKSRGLDLALLSCDAPAAAAAVFTTNRVQAAPVRLSRAHLRQSRGWARAVVVNSGNANCATGPAGDRVAQATATAAARLLDCSARQVFVCSTGVIGVPLPVENILRALPGLSRTAAHTPQAFHAFTRAILTTDTRPKWAAARCRIQGRTVRLLGCAKGAGMIAPRMATMLAFLVTDAALAPPLLQRMLRAAVAETFNRITVDGDTSTNDTVVLLASGAAGGRRLALPRFRADRRAATPAERDALRFYRTLDSVCRSLALQIVADGEGAQRVVEIEVRGARSAAAAERVARAVAESPLVKTALAGADPNWGRILAAAGRAGVAFDPARATIWLAGIKVFAHGRPLCFDERHAHRRLSGDYVSIVLDLGAARQRSRIETRTSARQTGHLPQATSRCIFWTCDFTREYVDLNARYRS